MFQKGISLDYGNISIVGGAGSRKVNLPGGRFLLADSSKANISLSRKGDVDISGAGKFTIEGKEYQLTEDQYLELVGADVITGAYISRLKVPQDRNEINLNQDQLFFTWENISNSYGDSRLFQLSKNFEFTDVIYSEITDKGSLNYKLKQPGTYYWRVISSDGVGKSPTYVFHVIDISAPLIMAPKIGQLLADLNGTIVILSEKSFVQKYVIELKNSNGITQYTSNTNQLILKPEVGPFSLRAKSIFTNQESEWSEWYQYSLEESLGGELEFSIIKKDKLKWGEDLEINPSNDFVSYFVRVTHKSSGLVYSNFQHRGHLKISELLLGVSVIELSSSGVKKIYELEVMPEYVENLRVSSNSVGTLFEYSPHFRAVESSIEKFNVNYDYILVTDKGETIEEENNNKNQILVRGFNYQAGALYLEQVVVPQGGNPIKERFKVSRERKLTTGTNKLENKAAEPSLNKKLPEKTPGMVIPDEIESDLRVDSNERKSGRSPAQERPLPFAIIEIPVTQEAYEYLVEIYHDNQLKKKVVSTKIKRPTIKIKNIRPGLYYIRIAYRLDSASQMSDFSNISKLYIKGKLSNARLNLPENKDEFDFAKTDVQIFSWQPVPGADSYTLFLAKDQKIRKVIFTSKTSDTTLSIDMTPFKNFNFLFWGVEAHSNSPTKNASISLIRQLYNAEDKVSSKMYATNTGTITYDRFSYYVNYNPQLMLLTINGPGLEFSGRGLATLNFDGGMRYFVSDKWSIAGNIGISNLDFTVTNLNKRTGTRTFNDATVEVSAQKHTLGLMYKQHPLLTFREGSPGLERAGTLNIFWGYEKRMKWNLFGLPNFSQLQVALPFAQMNSSIPVNSIKGFELKGGYYVTKFLNDSVANQRYIRGGLTLTMTRLSFNANLTNRMAAYTSSNIEFSPALGLWMTF